MSVMWTIAEGRKEGPFLAVRNHNTGERHDASQASVSYTGGRLVIRIPKSALQAKAAS